MGIKKKKIKEEKEKSEGESTDSTEVTEEQRQNYQNMVHQLSHPGEMNYQLLAKLQTIIDCLVHLVSQGKERNQLLKDSAEEEADEEEEDEEA